MGPGEIANSHVDQQQESKERRDVIAKEERRLEKRKAEKARTDLFLLFNKLLVHVGVFYLLAPL